MNLRCIRLLVLAAVVAALGPSVAAAQNDEHDHARHAGEAHDREAGAEHEGGHDEVHLTEAQHRRLELKVARAERGSAEALIRLPATIVFDADRIAQIGPRLRAKVVEVTKDLGDPVRAGEPVMIMDSVALGKAKAHYLTARARLETEQANYAREKKLAEQRISSQAALLEARARYREAEAALDAATEELRLYGLSRQAIESIQPGGKTPLSRYVLTSPIDGVVQERDVTPGQTVGPETSPIHVVDTARMWVMIQAYERNIPALAVGQTVDLRVRALPGQRFQGRVDWISKALDAKSRTLRVRAVVENPNGVLCAGMFGTAGVQTNAKGAAALVPVDAVQTVDGRPTVFVPGHENGAFRAVPVALGQESGGMVEVISGIHPGEPVVVAGAFDLKSVMTASGRSAAHSH